MSCTDSFNIVNQRTGCCWVCWGALEGVFCGERLQVSALQEKTVQGSIRQRTHRPRRRRGETWRRNCGSVPVSDNAGERAGKVQIHFTPVSTPFSKRTGTVCRPWQGELAFVRRGSRCTDVEITYNEFVVSAGIFVFPDFCLCLCLRHLTRLKKCPPYYTLFSFLTGAWHSMKISIVLTSVTFL